MIARLGALVAMFVAPLAVLLPTTPADAAGTPVTLNLLSINDFHGRVNTNMVKWGATIESLRAATSNPSIMVGAGDLIGASEFASALAQDQPAIDVLNALALDASAVGNHEFDQGWVDLRDRVIGPAGNRNADWTYLGANVYAKGTQDPVLPEYAMFDMSGVSVAVVGAVTEETRSLVSPGGITEIDFGNPATAVNRVARQLSDGNPDNGEAQVIVASFHAGASKGVGSDFATEYAKGGEFAQIADLDPAVDVIFNGHTHQAYAFNGPVPGVAGKTRPLVQTGQYADNVGQVELTVDSETGDVISYAARNVARLGTAGNPSTLTDADFIALYPSLAQVKSITDAALEAAKAIGNQPVGGVSADITTAFIGGSYATGVYAGGTRDDRYSESTLGDLVANALRDGIPADLGEPDLAVVTPGGLRAELRYAGDTATNPENTDGVVTYAEANGVLPFVNNLWLIDLTGAQLKTVFEQQFQPAGAQRSFLALGVSDNVTATIDATKPVGQRITSIWIDGQPLDLAATYTVSAFSFLGTGGDNFLAFQGAPYRDTGLIDRDVWIQYLRDHNPAAPDFARQIVDESGMPTQLYAGESTSFSLSKLNLTSLGSPQNTTVQVIAHSGGATEDLGTFPVTDGGAAISFTVPEALTAAGRIELVAQPTGTTVSISLGERAATSVSATAAPITYGQAGSVEVSVAPADATGAVELVSAGQTVATADLVDGSASFALDALSLPVGSHPYTVTYSGDRTHQPSSAPVTVTVVKAAPTVSVAASPSVVLFGRGTSTLTISVAADGFTPTGTVAVWVNGRWIRNVTLTNGTATTVVGPFRQLGTQTVRVRYRGDAQTNTGSATTTITVRRRL
ncbi:MAG: 5'-nucleotidase C-terminal domain-containing protein [Gordonia sp. (in: high G+C Gram-positive bacteria)]|uniref:5'-nucleotidase C-terminal domain-containing protein n=1 Tax=Gordonia sp. (in: high G+C Gram-positive bacteria) TaxID=84139 RepID=UPI003BB7C6F5